MKTRTLVLSFACIAVAAAAPAQDMCPRTRAVEVAPRGTLGPDRACDTGFDVRIQDVRLTTGRKSCPLFAVVTTTTVSPRHPRFFRVVPFVAPEPSVPLARSVYLRFPMTVFPFRRIRPCR